MLLISWEANSVSFFYQFNSPCGYALISLPRVEQEWCGWRWVEGRQDCSQRVLGLEGCSSRQPGGTEAVLTPPTGRICRCLWRGVPRAALLKLAFNLHRSWMIHVNILLEAWVYMRAWILHWKKGEGKLLSVRYQSAGLCSAREEEMRCSYALSTLTSQHLAFKYLRYYETGMVLGKFMAAHRFWIEERKWVAHPLFKESHEWC